MSARKSIHRRLSRQSIRSQMSGFLNPDSDIDSDEEGNPLWFKDFEGNSMTTRPSARFSLAQNDTPVLDPDSESESMPLLKSWWKNLDNTTKGGSPLPRESREMSSVSEKSLDASEAAVLNEGIAKPRSKMRRVKRKSSGRNVFSDILSSTSRSQNNPESSRNSEIQDKQESSVSYTDSSVEKIMQPPVKRKKKSKMPRNSPNFESDSDEDGPDIFQDALEAPQSDNDSHHDQPGTSRISQKSSFPGLVGSTETVQLRSKDGESESRGSLSDISEETVHLSSVPKGRRSPLVSHPKKQTKFIKTGNRISANFDDLLADAQSEDDPSIRGEEAVNRSNIHVESGDQPAPGLAGPESDISLEEDYSISEEIKKQRIILSRKKRKRFFSELPESLNTSIRSEPVKTHKKTMDLVRPGNVSLFDVERRSSKQGNNRSRTSGSLNLEAEEHRTARTSVRGSSGANKSIRRSADKEYERAMIPTRENVDDEENQTDRTPIRRSHVADASRSEEWSTSERGKSTVPSSSSDIEMEDQSTIEVSHRSSGAKESDKEGRFGNKANDREKSSRSSEANDRQNRPMSTGDRRSSGANRSGRRSVNKENDRSRISRSLDVDDKENERAKTSHDEYQFYSKEDAMNQDDQSVESARPSDHVEEEENPPARKRSRSRGTNRSDKERRSRNEAGDRDKSSGSSNVGNIDNRSTRRADRRSVGANKSDRRSVNKEDERPRISRSPDVDDEEIEAVGISHGADREKSSGSSNVGDKENGSTRRADRRAVGANESDRRFVNKEDERRRISRSLDVDDEEIEAVGTSHGVDESDAEGQAMNEEDNRVESPSPSDIEDEPLLARKPHRRLSSTNQPGKEGRSGNETKDQEKSPRFSNVGINRNRSPIISVRRSGSANKSRDSLQDTSLLNQSRISEKQLNIEDKNTSRRVNKKSISQKLPVSNDQQEDEDPRNISGSINRFEEDQEDSRELARLEIREAATPSNVEAEIPSTSSAADKTRDKTKSTGGGQRTGYHFSFADSIRRGSVQDPSVFGRGFDPETLSQMKIKLEKVKKQEHANLKYINSMKNTKINDYFKSTNYTGAAKGPKKSPTKPKPVNKAYIVDGKVYKRPKLPRPKKWATDRLYNYLWKKMEPKYNIRTRVRSEKFIIDLSNVATIIQRRSKYENYKAELNTLLKEMAHLGIIKTRNDFHLFCQDFLPYEFRIKVIPMLLPGNVRNIPFYPDKLHTPILDSSD